MDFGAFIRKELETKDVYPGRLAVIHKFLCDEEHARRLFKQAVTINVPGSRYDHLDERARRVRAFVIDVGKWQLEKGLEFDLAGEPARAKQCYEWAVENCFMSDEEVEEEARAKNFDLVANGFLWRGYALLMLGRTIEACRLLKLVPVYYRKEKLSGHEVWQVFEPNLPKALIPLCEYKMNPVADNREKARQGLEDFINSFKEHRFRLDALLYYYHLKEMFPEVYADNSNGTAKPTKKVNSISTPDLKPEDVRRQGAVVVYDPTGYLNIFGTPKELVQYVQRVGKLGGFPLLSRLLDFYNVENTPGMDPVELEKECVRLLEQTDNVWLHEKTEPLLDVAREAQEEDGENIVLYLDPDIPMKD